MSALHRHTTTKQSDDMYNSKFERVVLSVIKMFMHNIIILKNGFKKNIKNI